MATYDGLFDTLGLRDWCDAEASDGPMSMADLMARTQGGDEAAGTPLRDLPFPSLDALHDACAAIPQSRALTKGLETGFLDIRDSLRFVVDPLTQPLSWALENMLWVMTETPWWVMFPVLLLITWAVGRSWKVVGFVALVIAGLAFVDHYDVAMQTLAIIFVCAGCRAC